MLQSMFITIRLHKHDVKPAIVWKGESLFCIELWQQYLKISRIYNVTNVNGLT